MNAELFVTATKEKYRFPWNGSISTEDVWDLSPTQLDSLYRKLLAESEKIKGESLLKKRSAAETELSNKLEVVKAIFEAKQAEADAQKERAANAQKKQRIMAIIAQKQDAALEGMSVDDLEKMLDEIDA